MSLEDNNNQLENFLINNNKSSIESIDKDINDIENIINQIKNHKQSI